MTRRFLAPRGAVALLDNEDEAQVAAAAAEPADNANSLETDLVEVADSAAEGDAAEVETEETVETKEALEQYAAALESYLADGGIDVKAARMMNIGLEHMTDRVGFGAGTVRAISTEAFSGPSSRGRGTQVALEDIKERIQKIWEAIKAAIKRAIEWVKDHFNKIFGAAEKLQKRAKAIQEKTKDITGSAKEAKFDNERLVKALHVNGTVAGLPGQLEAVKKVAEDVFGHTADFGAKAGEAVIEVLNKEDGSVANIGCAAYSPMAMRPLSDSDAASAGFEKAPDGLALFRTVELPGGKAILGRYPSASTTGEAAVKALTGTTSAVSAFNNKAAEVTKAELPTLAVADVTKIAEAVDGLAGLLITYRAKAGKAEEVKKKILAAAEKLSKAAVKEDDKAKAEFMGAKQKIAQASTASLDKPAPQFAQYVLIVGKSALDYAEESLKQYGKK